MSLSRNGRRCARTLIALTGCCVGAGAARAAVTGFEADIASLDVGDQSIGLILDDDANDNIYIQLVIDPNTGEFAGGRFGHGNNVAGWSGMTGGNPTFGISDRFFTAHVRATYDNVAQTVTLALTNLDGNVNRSLSVSRGGWVNTPGGSDVGFGGNGKKISLDNFRIINSPICDTFDRENGDIGRLWRVDKPDAFIQSNTARADRFSLAIWVSEECGACTGVEKFNAKCVEKTSGNVIIAKVTNGQPGGLVQINDSNSGQGEELVISNRGKAKMKFTNAESGLHFVFASFPCGYTLESRPTCP